MQDPDHFILPFLNFREFYCPLTRSNILIIADIMLSSLKSDKNLRKKEAVKSGLNHTQNTIKSSLTLKSI